MFKIPQEALRHHVTGAIERGEKVAVTAQEAPSLDAPIYGAERDGYAVRFPDGAVEYFPDFGSALARRDAAHTAGIDCEIANVYRDGWATVSARLLASDGHNWYD